jgi:hypothetical protein
MALAPYGTQRLRGKQFVIATNGQYRPKDEAQASQWADAHSELQMLAPVAIGDEPGYNVEHDGKTISTANRPATAYANEIVVLQRLLNRQP